MKIEMLVRLLLMCFVYLCSFSTDIFASGQEKFEKTYSTNDIKLSYQWRDHFDTSRSISFTLPRGEVQDQYRSVKKYMPEIVQRYVYIELMKKAQKIDPREASVRIKRVGKDLNIIVSSQSPEMLDKWQAVMLSNREDAYSQYLEENYYTRYQNHLGQTGIKPDHLRYLSESRELLVPVAQAFFEELGTGGDTRDYVGLLLSWIQNIPYNELEDRLVSNGAGYSSPVEVLTTNLGDCDSKTTLTAALMRALFPNLKMAILYLPNHALLAANIANKETDEYIEIDGYKYVLIEPTGPALLMVGNIDNKSSVDIASGMYSLEKVP
jgi:hypothetical protein